MATAPQGGLSQVAPKPASLVADTSGKQAENVEELSKSQPTGFKDKSIDDLGQQREAMNTALLRMRESLDYRKNRMFDPVLMQAAAGFLKPTKTGSFGESLGYAAENAGAASEREMLHDRENQKLEMELLGKEQELRQQLGGDQIMSMYLSGQKTGASTTAPPPAGGAVMSQTGAPRVTNTAPPVDLTTPSGQQQAIEGVRSGSIPVTNDLLAYASRVSPKLLPFFQEIRRSQNEEEKNRIARDELEFKRTSEKRKVTPRDTRTERELSGPEYVAYQAALSNYFATGDKQKYYEFLDSKGWLDPEQVRERTIPKAGEAPKPIIPSKSSGEIKSEDESAVARAKKRAEEDEAQAVLAINRGGNNALNMETLAKDVLSLTESNTRAFNLMQNATVRDSVLRAIEQGASVTAGPMTVAFNLPVRIALQGNKEYQLTPEDISALQLFQQKQSAITAEMRKMSRSTGEGATDKSEGRLYEAIGLLPTDSAKVLALKSEAIIQRSRFDFRAGQLLTRFQTEQPNKSFAYFQHNNEDYLELRKNYIATLDKMRADTAEYLRTSPKPAAKPKTDVSAKETYSQRLERLKKERGD